MKIFVTGGTGAVGTPVISALIAAGHTILGLARSDASAKKLESLGAVAIRGFHTDYDILENTAAKCDAAIHLAFNHELAFTGNMEQACAEERGGITAICQGLLKSGATGKTFFSTGGTLGGNDYDEQSEKPALAGFDHRNEAERLALSFVPKGLRVWVVRLAPVTLGGQGSEHPFIATQIQAAKKNGSAVYIDDGSAIWPWLHVNDAATLYCRALTEGPGGAALHATSDKSYTVKEIAEHIGSKLGVPVKSVSTSQAMESGYGFIGVVMGLTGGVTNLKTKSWTGWQAQEVDLFKTIDSYAW